MSKTYRSSDSVSELKKLKEDDIVIFIICGEEYEYSVCYNFLNLEEGPSDEWSNDTIFTVLGLDKEIVTKECYGYEARDDDWPCANNDDYAALTRVVKYLFSIVNKKYKLTPAVKRKMAKTKAMEAKKVKVLSSRIPGAMYICCDTDGGIFAGPAIEGLTMNHGCIEWGDGSTYTFTGNYNDEMPMMKLSERQCRDIYGDVPKEDEAWLVTPNKRSYDYTWVSVHEKMKFSD